MELQSTVTSTRGRYREAFSFNPGFSELTLHVRLLNSRMAVALATYMVIQVKNKRGFHNNNEHKCRTPDLNHSINQFQSSLFFVQTIQQNHTMKRSLLPDELSISSVILKMNPEHTYHIRSNPHTYYCRSRTVENRKLAGKVTRKCAASAFSHICSTSLLETENHYIIRNEESKRKWKGTMIGQRKKIKNKLHLLSIQGQFCTRIFQLFFCQSNEWSWTCSEN